MIRNLLVGDLKAPIEATLEQGKFVAAVLQGTADLGQDASFPLASSVFCSVCGIDATTSPVERSFKVVVVVAVTVDNFFRSILVWVDRTEGGALINELVTGTLIEGAKTIGVPALEELGGADEVTVRLEVMGGAKAGAGVTDVEGAT